MLQYGLEFPKYKHGVSTLRKRKVSMTFGKLSILQAEILILWYAYQGGFFFKISQKTGYQHVFRQLFEICGPLFLILGYAPAYCHILF